MAPPRLHSLTHATASGRQLAKSPYLPHPIPQTPDASPALPQWDVEIRVAGAAAAEKANLQNPGFYRLFL